MTDAKPCPFCGSMDLYGFEYPFKRKPGIRGCFIKCNQCGAASGNHETIDDALKAWNERKWNDYGDGVEEMPVLRVRKD